MISAFCTGSSIQSLLDRISRQEVSRSSSCGLASASGTPNGIRLGRIPRTTTLVGLVLPPKINPAIIMSLPVPTKPRVLILPSLELTAPTSYTSIKPTPVPLFLALRMAVYAPGSKVATMQDSRGVVGGHAVQLQSIQLSVVIVGKPFGPWSSSTGSSNGSGTGSEGPIPRTITCLGSAPVIMKPPIPTLASVRTRRRVETLSGCTGPGPPVAVAVGLADPVTVEVAVGVAVPSAVMVAVAVAVAVGVPVELRVGDGGTVAVGVGLG